MMDVKGMVFKNEHETNGEKWYSYVLSISSKNQNDEWESASMPIRFWSECTPPENKTRIKITDGWLKPYKFKYKDGDETVVGVFCKDYEVVSKAEPSGFTAIVDDDVPF
jgi:hypothetical protein